MAVIPVDGEDSPADVCVIELGGTIGMLNVMFDRGHNKLFVDLLSLSN